MAAKSYRFLGHGISGRFTIPSGIVTTNPRAILKIAKEMPQIGIITTKSIGLEERKGYREPILQQYAPGCFINAVGLTNPGAKEFARQLSEIKPKIPADRFLLISIFGASAEEFSEVARILEPYADGFELNLSCPHAKGYGMAIGQDPELVKEIVVRVKHTIKVPVIPKLTPNTDKLKEITKAAVEAGADAICAINTTGPGYYTFEGIPVLSNKCGGMSGRGILPIGLKRIKEISTVTQGKIPVIGCGGISSAKDVMEYEKAGASIFGIGSALAGMSSKEIMQYFIELDRDLESRTNNAEKLLKENNMEFKKYKLVENKKLADDLSILVFDKGISIRPGQFVFLWLPGFGEKPFSVLDDSPLTLAIQKRGCLTEKLLDLSPGSQVLIRGPYGNEMKVDKNAKIILVGGGCGIAAFYQLAKEVNSKDTESFFGARDMKHVLYLEELTKHSTVWVSTNDGSLGAKGFVSGLLQKRMEEIKQEISPSKKIIFLNCGPEPMIDAVLPIEEQYAAKENIFCAIDYITKCGIGICGSCASRSGKRICVDGPFISIAEL